MKQDEVCGVMPTPRRRGTGVSLAAHSLLFTLKTWQALKRFN